MYSKEVFVPRVIFGEKEMAVNTNTLCDCIRKTQQRICIVTIIKIDSTKSRFIEEPYTQRERRSSATTLAMGKAPIKKKYKPF